MFLTSSAYHQSATEGGVQHALQTLLFQHGDFRLLYELHALMR